MLIVDLKLGDLNRFPLYVIISIIKSNDVILHDNVDEDYLDGPMP